MKIFIVFLLSSQFTHAAVTFSVERSDPAGLSKLQIIEGKTNLEISKTSNWFDRKVDYRLGEFTATKAQLGSLLKRLEKLDEQINQANSKLKEFGTDINSLNNNSDLHNTYFMLNGIKILNSSPFYNKMMELASSIDTSTMRLIDGVELSKDKKEYLFYTSGKVRDREKFNTGFFCDSVDRPSKCLARKWGTFYLE